MQADRGMAEASALAGALHAKSIGAICLDGAGGK
ncbi:hypothetical protein GGE12_000093 [Rhizobium mongolense]|uniref:Uncharacterized protein n=1 Tax=Rhizobium mongolense TaxID=57676 RepID=A0A7W6RH22_9HYPH|nr:hypothetical protein [Rhizobium mongolense]